VIQQIAYGLYPDLFVRAMMYVTEKIWALTKESQRKI
jgi:hypothetical protein